MSLFYFLNVFFEKKKKKTDDAVKILSSFSCWLQRTSDSGVIILMQVKHRVVISLS